MARLGCLVLGLRVHDLLDAAPVIAWLVVLAVAPPVLVWRGRAILRDPRTRPAGEHRRRPHVLEPKTSGAAMVTTQYGPICRHCGFTPQSRFHIPAPRPNHKKLPDLT